jgi:uncharacterized protein (TIGR00255 family)
MLLSMTGFGKSSVVVDNQSLAVQMKSLNSKSLDIFMKLPAFLREKEIEIRTILSNKLERGKIDLSITNDELGSYGMHSINFKLADFYREQIGEMTEKLSLDPPEDLVSLLLKMPNVLQTSKESVNDAEWQKIEQAIFAAIDELTAWRASEGKALETDIAGRILTIITLLDKIVPLKNAREDKIRKKLMSDLNNLGSEISIDMNRLEQEIIYYLDRIDISEEIVRANKHCEYFIELLQEKISNGKKLMFVSQEILRELNTMGVKANDAEIQKLTVEMKDEIEKVREQLSNIL